MTSALRVPTAGVLVAGLLAGPHGAALLTRESLEMFRPLLSLAILTVGVVVGLSVHSRSLRSWSTIRPVLVDALAIGAAVAIVFAAAPGGMSWAVSAPVASTAVLVACMTLRMRDMPAGFSIDRTTQVTAAVLAVSIILTIQSESHTAWTFAPLTAAGLGLLCLGGWLLTVETHAAAEKGGFVLATVLLLAGAAAYFGLPEILIGFLAGALWNAIGGPGSAVLLGQAQTLQGPLRVLLLFVAAAAVPLSIMVFVWVIYLTLVRRGLAAYRGVPSSEHALEAGDEPLRFDRTLVTLALATNAYLLWGADVTSESLLAIVVMDAMVSPVMTRVEPRMLAV